MGVRVVTDSACDLPDALVAALGITIVPLSIRFGDEELVDREQLTVAEFWDRLTTASVLPETAAPSAGAFEARFRELADAGATGIICINLSSRLSATMQAATVAAKAVAEDCPIEVIDSLTCSMGLGSLCLVAARHAQEGADLETIVSDVTDRRDRTKLFGTLDTLEFLKRGGRIGNARALLGSMLSIKPVVEVRDGVVEEAGKVRTRSKALQVLVDHVRAQPVENLAVLHGNAPDVDELLDLLDPIVPKADIVTGVVGPVIGTHAGPRVIGVTFQTAKP
ncbi:MAG TPA: DegV family protein [Acidimicrobiia bacterium]|nr:DegV family protein [Acidimicrobiia bacterium]